MTEAATSVDVGAVETVIEAPPHVRVLVPLIKGDRMDLCLEKLVEVGANELIVWRAERSIVKLDPAVTHRPADATRQLILVEVEGDGGPIEVMLNNSHWHGNREHSEPPVPIPGSKPN